MRIARSMSTSDPSPHGMENNWVQTMPRKGRFTILRLHGPQEPWFNKTWKPGAIELVQ